jgi:hypothetical protein
VGGLLLILFLTLLVVCRRARNVDTLQHLEVSGYCTLRNFSFVEAYLTLNLL